jgi:hypothetical protein
MRLRELLEELVDLDWDSADQYPAPDTTPAPTKDPNKGQLKGKARKLAFKNPFRKPAAVSEPDFGRNVGVFAKVTPVANNPHLIRKEEKFYTDPNQNAYFQYVWTLKKHMASNPYLPRIYVAKEDSDPENPKLKKFTYVMEKLIHPYDAASKSEGRPQFSQEALLGLGDRVIRDFDTKINKYFGNFKKTVDQVDPLDIWRYIVGFIGNAIDHDDYSGLTDENLIEACHIVLGAQYHIRKGGGQGVNDIHSDNIMVRLTSMGPQLVITDPLG